MSETERDGHQTQYYYTKYEGFGSSFPVWHSALREGPERREKSKVVSSNPAINKGKNKKLMREGHKVRGFECWVAYCEEGI